jgi:hypothetical protein
LLDNSQANPPTIKMMNKSARNISSAGGNVLAPLLRPRKPGLPRLLLAPSGVGLEDVLAHCLPPSALWLRLHRRGLPGPARQGGGRKDRLSLGGMGALTRSMNEEGDTRPAKQEVFMESIGPPEDQVPRPRFGRNTSTHRTGMKMRSVRRGTLAQIVAAERSCSRSASLRAICTSGLSWTFSSVTGLHIGVLPTQRRAAAPKKVERSAQEVAGRPTHQGGPKDGRPAWQRVEAPIPVAERAGARGSQHAPSRSPEPAHPDEG